MTPVKYEVLALYYSSAEVVDGRRWSSSIRRQFEVVMVFKGVSDDDLVNECRWRKTVGEACGLQQVAVGRSKI